jgi:putative FmdB family regulatory protein
MPIYEYECLKCKKKFEVLQKISSEPLEACIYCRGKVKKLISVSAFQFKGNGWYITDYKNKKESPSKEKKTTISESSTQKNKNKDVTHK